MTTEILEKAKELRAEIDTLLDIQDVIDNAKSRRLAAIDATRRPVNDAVLPEDLAERFKRIILDEIYELEREFAAL